MEPLTGGDPQAVSEFRLRARLGAGGMGRVYLATSPAGRFVAVKVIHPEFSGDRDFARRFRSEADAARQVSGLYTAPVVSAGVDDRPPWLATAFVSGPSLEGIVSQHGPLPLPALWRLGAGLAEALRAIHSVGLVHRDLKPANVILALDGPRVIDFGIARAVTDDRLTATGSVIGTPAYMSPEQVEGEDAGPPTDVFALGCVLGFAASGTPPFGDGPPAPVMYRVARTEPDLAAIPPQLCGLIAACLAKDPARRPDPGQIAAQCAAGAGPAGVAPTAFWPDDVAAAIRSQQAAVNAQVQALVSQPTGTRPASPLGAGPHPATQPAALPGPGTHPATQFAGFHPATELAAPSAMPGAPTATIGPVFPGAPGAPWAPSQLRPSPVSSRPAPKGTSRRGLLIGAGIGGVVAAIGGGTAWALSGVDGPAKPGTVAWAFSAGSQPVDANPTVAGGVVYFGGSDDMLYAVKAATGEKLWATSVSKVSAGPAVAAGRVFASAEHGDFYVLDAASGTVAWSVSGSSLGPFQKDFATDGKLVAVATGHQNLSMFNAANGAVIWNASGRVDLSLGRTVAMQGDVVYTFSQVGMEFGVLVALSPVNGHQTRQYGDLLASDGIGTGVTFSEGIMYFGADEGPLYAFDTATGHVKWTYRPGSGRFPQSDPVVADGMVYFADDHGLIHAVSTVDGHRVWTRPSEHDYGIGPGVGGGHVYILTLEGLRQLDAKTGEPGWAFSLSTQVPFVSTPAVANGLVLCGNGDGSLYAIRA